MPKLLLVRFPILIILEIINAYSNKINNGILADIAPTVLDIMGVQKPDEMTGKSLINWKI